MQVLRSGIKTLNYLLKLLDTVLTVCYSVFMKYGKQTKLAEAVDVTPQLINQIYRGKRRAGYDTAKKIARIAGVSVEDIMDATPEQVVMIFDAINIELRL